MKIVVIGGGSSYTPELVEGMIKGHTSFPVSEICLVDLEAGAVKLSAVAGLGQRMLHQAGLEEKIKLTSTLDRSTVLPAPIL